MDEEARRKVLTLLERHRVMSVATLRPDGWPQATTVVYANTGFTLYFLCGLNSQKAANLSRDDRVSVTVGHDADALADITGLSMAAHACPVTDAAEAETALCMLGMKYPKSNALRLPAPTMDNVKVFRVSPVVISLIDYSKGFGHADLIRC